MDPFCSPLSNCNNSLFSGDKAYETKLQYEVKLDAARFNAASNQKTLKAKKLKAQAPEHKSQPEAHIPRMGCVKRHSAAPTAPAEQRLPAWIIVGSLM